MFGLERAPPGSWEFFSLKFDPQAAGSVRTNPSQSPTPSGSGWTTSLLSRCLGWGRQHYYIFSLHFHLRFLSPKGLRLRISQFVPLPPVPTARHVPLWDRVPSLQVDPAPAAAVRRHFRHYRRGGPVRMGRGRWCQVPLRQHVGRMPGQEQQLGLQDPHGAP